MKAPSRAIGSMPALAVLAVVGCGKASPSGALEGPAPSDATVEAAAPQRFKVVMPVLANRYAFIPPQCYTKTEADGPGGRVPNPCYACHVHSREPNFTDDGSLQTALAFPPGAGQNFWRNVLDPPFMHVPAAPADEVLAYVRRSNYFEGEGDAARPRAIRAAEGEDPYRGFQPDAFFRFDERGFDRRPDGSMTGWRAFAYYPFLGTFFPTNGSMDDVLVRLDPSFREDAAGHESEDVYRVNLAVVEALVKQADVPLAKVDERPLGVDLDRDGRLGEASWVTFTSASPMSYVGRAHERQRRGELKVDPGLFPVGTEFLHTVRYLDVDEHGGVVMAKRLKELRYAVKSRAFTYDELRAVARAESEEARLAPDGEREFFWERDRGVYNAQGWYYQGFIEAKDGTLRPQTLEESLTCKGCHGGVGATTDGTFAFARKLGGKSLAEGWFHWSRHGLAGLPEPRRADGSYEYTRYLTENGAGDELRENAEVRARFFDARGQLRSDAVNHLHADIGQLLLPSAARALDLDRAYRAIVLEQSFTRGRDAVLGHTDHVHAQVREAGPTGIRVAVAGPQPLGR